MNTFSRIIAAGSLLFIVASCGTEKAIDSGGEPAATGSTEDTGSSSAVASVSLRESGGLKPATLHVTFSADAAPPKGFTTSDVAAVIDAAEAFTTSGADLAAMPSNTCCDRVSYVVTITLDDGTSDTYKSLDGLNQPKAFDVLLSQLG